MKVLSATLPLEIQDVLEMLYFLLQLENKGIIDCANLVCTRFSHDLLGTIRKLECRNSFFRVINNWTDGRNQGRSGVATQRVLEQPRDLGVSVAHKVLLCALCQALDYFAKTTQTQVDCFQLEHVLLVHDLLFMYLLTASQVTEIQLASEYLTFFIRAV